MKRIALLAVALLTACIPASATITSLVHWDFNDAASFNFADGALRAALFSPDGGARSDQAYMGTIFFFSNNTLNSSVGITTFQGSNVNGVLPSGSSLAPGMALVMQASYNNGRFLEFGVDGRGFSSIFVSYATRGSTRGFNNNQFQYSPDGGVTYIAFGTVYSGAHPNYTRHVYDLSGIADLDNNPDLRFRIVFSGASHVLGNNRIDNLQITANGVVLTDAPEPGALGLMAIGIVIPLLSRDFWRRQRNSPTQTKENVESYPERETL